MIRKLLFAVLIVCLSCASVFAQYTATIDAQKDAFYDGLTGPADGYFVLPSTAFVFEPPTDNADLAGEFWTAWDETYFYMYAEIDDDFVVVDNATNWQNDCIEIKVDADPLAGATSGIAAGRLTALDADLAQEPAGVDNLNGDNALADVGGVAWAVTEDDYARGLTEDGGLPVGWIGEFRVPWEFMAAEGRSFTLPVGSGTIAGFAINLSDNDGGARSHMQQWSAGMADEVWNNPQLLGTIELLDGGMINWIAENSAGSGIVNDSAAVWYDPANWDLTGIDIDQTSHLPNDFELKQNYPNPFNPDTKISFSLQNAEEVTLSVFDVTGRLVDELIAGEHYAAGTYEVSWSADANGQELVSGVYFYQLSTSSFVATKKMVLMQ